MCHVSYTAILPRWWRRPEENLLGKESGPAISALRLVSVHPGHRQTHQEVCSLPERSEYDFKKHTHTHCVTQHVQTISHKHVLIQRAPPVITVTSAYGIK